VLTLLWAVPAAAALAVAVLGRRAAWLGPLGSALGLALAVALWPQAGSLAAAAPWLPGAGGALAPVSYRLGLSGLSLVLVLLTLLLTALAGLGALRRGPGCVAWLTLLGAAATGMFLARDLVLFYVFWEASLVPTYFLLLGWGGPGRRRAAWKFLLYNVAGSVALLAAIAALVAFGAAMPGLGAPGGTGSAVPAAAAGPLALALLVAFAVKTPLWPLHGWVADTYAELPAPAAALVAGVQSKAGLYGMLAVLLPLLPDGMRAWAGVWTAAGTVSLLYGALVALAEDDARRLLAYSSVSHLALVAVAFTLGGSAALTGGVVQMVAHGLFSAGLFLLVGMLEERLGGSVRLGALGGLAKGAPALAGGLILLAMAALGLPGLAGFPGELLMVVGIYARSPWLGVLAGVALVLAAVYLLRLVQLVLHGRPGPAAAPDLRAGERWLLAPLAALVVVLGLYPQPIPQQAAAAVAAIAGPAAQGGASP
jgi:NADH-quinone oxidoreductase subunit M